ncbi:MAG: LacI family DNA-binding transcriptional regulator [Candidatus Sumerlaeota bacterium]
MTVKQEMDNKITQKDIARACNVSDTVVSAVLRNIDSGAVRFSKETRDKVLEACERMGYRLNRSARSLKRRSHGAVGIIGHTFGYLPENFMQAFAYRMRDADILLNIELAHYDGSLPRLVTTDSVDCLLTFEPLHPEILDAIDRRFIPLVQINTNERHGPGCVTLDEESAVEMSLRLAGELGTRRLALVYHQPFRQHTEHFSTRLRKERFTECAVEEGFKKPRELNIKGDARIESAPIAAFLEQHSDIDFIYAADEAVAVGCWHGAVQVGRQVGKDIEIVTYAHTGLTEAIAPSLHLFQANWSTFAKKLLACLSDQTIDLQAVSGLSPIAYSLKGVQEKVSPAV